MSSDARHAQGLYIDLLLRAIANTIYEDRPIDPWSSDEYDSSLREDGRDWPQVAHTMIGSKRLLNLRMAAETVMRENIPGDMIETGVWRGGACILMRGILEAYQDSTRKVFVADSFAGLPAPDPERYPHDSGDTHHTMEPLAISREQVARNFDRYGLLDDQTVFIEGFFEDTLPGYDFNSLSLVRLDGDMYSSTIVAIEALYPRLSEGGFLIVDDFGAVEGCRQAIEDYRSAHGITDKIHPVDWTGVYWRKGGGQADNAVSELTTGDG